MHSSDYNLLIRADGGPGELRRRRARTFSADSAPLGPGLKGRHSQAQGKALGWAAHWGRALTGRNNFWKLASEPGSPFQGWGPSRFVSQGVAQGYRIESRWGRRSRPRDWGHAPARATGARSAHSNSLHSPRHFIREWQASPPALNVFAASPCHFQNLFPHFSIDRP